MKPSTTHEQRSQARQQLLNLTLAHFKGDEFAEFLRRNGCSEVVDAIPWVADQQTYHHELVLALDRRGLLDARLLDALTAQTGAADEVRRIAGDLGVAMTPPAPQPAIQALVESLRGSPLDDPEFIRLHALGSRYYDMLMAGDPAEPTSATVQRLATKPDPEALPALGWLARRVYDVADPGSELASAAEAVVELTGGRTEADEAERTIDLGGARGRHETERAIRDRPGDSLGSGEFPSLVEPGPETILPSRFLADGVAAARAVLQVRHHPVEGPPTMCSGWLIAPSLVVVPAHVFGAYNRTALGGTFVVESSAVERGRIEVRLDFDAAEDRIRSSDASIEILDERLDLAILRLAEDFPDLTPLRVRTDAAPAGTQRISMIHHFQGGPKSVSLFGGQVLDNDGHEIVYLAATGPGSAGAPVFDETWRVIGTHRAWRGVRSGGGTVRAKSGTATPALLRWIRESQAVGGRLWPEVVAAQPDLKTVDATLRRRLSGSGTDDPPRAPLLITVVDPDHPLDEIPDLRIDARIGTTVTATGTLRSVERLTEDPAVIAVEGSPTGAVPECWLSVPHVKADLVHAAVGPAGGERGAGAIVAVIDNGVDVQHEAFLDAEGKSRIAAFWDQRDPAAPIGGAGPASTVSDDGRAAAQRWNLHYGALYVREDVERFVADQQIPANFPARARMAHGTSVASIAAGRRTGDDRTTHFGGGVAPEATLIVVRPDPEDESIGYAKGYIDALTFIDVVATELGLPVVVNISAGMNAGSHDGTSKLERACEEFLGYGGKPGRVVVKSAGNERQRFRHAQLEAAQGALSTLSWTTERVPNGSTAAPDVMELWFAAENSYRFQLQPPTGPPSPQVSTNDPDLANADEMLANRNRFTLRFEAYNQDNGHGYLRLEISAGDAAEIEPGIWSLLVSAVRVVNTDAIHGWIELNPHRIAAFTTYATDEVTLTVPGTAPDVITVGATKVDELMIPFENSSLGPTRGRVGCEKPVIMAPGVGIRTAKAGSSDLLDDEGGFGTSYAAPHVAGAIALMLSARARSNAPQLNTSQVQVALRRSAKHYTGRWSGTTGYGELDVAALLGELSRF